MDLGQLAGEMVQEEDQTFGRGLDATRAFDTLIPLIGNEDRTKALLSAVFWQMVTSHDSFTELLDYHFRDFPGPRLFGNLRNHGSEMIIVMHDDETGIQRFDLLILLPQFPFGMSHSLPLSEFFGPISRRSGREFLETEFGLWVVRRRRELDEQRQAGLPVEDLSVLLETIARFEMDFIQELHLAQPFSILVSHKPQTIPTNAVASPSWGIGLHNGVQPISTVGVATRTRQGHVGVTACLHGVVPDPESLYDMYNAQGASCVVGKKVWVSGVEGTIRSADLITDSCFIEVDSSHLPPTMHGIRGPLEGAGPGRGARARFEGITSGLQRTVVEGCDLNIPFVPRSEQAKIYTKPVTRRGDSGAALLNEQLDVLGFSHYRTALNAELEYSDWIWARSVYNVLLLE